MKNMILTESKNHAIPVDEFVAAWIIWVERYHPQATWQTFCMPRLNEHEILETALQRGKAGSLDVMLRMLAPDTCRNTMQSTNKFMLANKKWIAGCQTKSPKGREAAGAKLKDAALNLWNKLGGIKQKALLANAEAMADGDIEVSKNKKSGTSKLCENALDRSEGFPYYDLSHLTLSASPDWVRDFVHWIDKDPFQPRYRRNPRDHSVTGWGARLNTYFWPNPDTDAAANAAIITPVTAGLQSLYSKVQNAKPWNIKDQADSIKFANAVFKWGGVATRTMTWQIIRAVMESVTKGSRIRNAPMNSGWTKVGAFASAGTPSAQVIWDSRVAASLVSRLDAMCVAAGQNAVPPPLNDLGYVNGRGGSRPRPLKLRWRNGYGCWEAQFAASIFVREIQAYLNNHISSYPKTNGGKWTLLEVEQVLFMDGY